MQHCIYIYIFIYLFIYLFIFFYLFINNIQFINLLFFIYDLLIHRNIYVYIYIHINPPTYMREIQEIHSFRIHLTYVLSARVRRNEIAQRAVDTQTNATAASELGTLHGRGFNLVLTR